MKLVEDYIDQHYPGCIKWLRVLVGTLRDQLQFSGVAKEKKEYCLFLRGMLMQLSWMQETHPD
jgi:hypothetical protein